MNIIYKHKKTGNMISLTDIKSKTDYTVEFVEKCIISPYKQIKTTELPIIYTYYLRDIPFSDDFELVIEDNPYDFDIYEIHVLLNALELYPYISANETKVKDKLVKIYKKLRKGY